MKRTFLSIFLCLLLAGCISSPFVPELASVEVVLSRSNELAPLPERYEDLELSYLAMEENALEQGDKVSYLLQKGELWKIWELFDESLRAQVPYAQFEREMKGFSDQHPIGDMIASRFFSIGRSSYFVIVHEWGKKGLAIYIDADGLGTIHDFSTIPLDLRSLHPVSYPVSLTTFRLPFDGLWYVAWGGLDELHNIHVKAPSQQFAYDFVIWQDGATCRNDCTQNDDYYVFGQPVLAPAAGEVVAAAGDQTDVAPGNVIGKTDPGNYVSLKVAEREYFFIAHLQQNSITVKPGELVKAGQIIGRVGNSGNTSEPHLHIQLQDSPQFSVRATSLPLYFSNYLANGEPVEKGIPEGSQFIQQP